MEFYVYFEKAELGKESLGTANKSIWRDLGTPRGAIRRAVKYARGRPFRLFSFTNFYNDKTFREIARQG